MFNNEELLSKVVSSVYIYGKNGNIYRNPSPVLSTTLHELSHIAHCSSVGFLKFTQTEDHIKEAYTTAVQWDMTIKEYYDLYLIKNKKLGDLLKPIICQQWPYHGRNNKYSPLFIDMIDDYDQNIGGAYLVDKVKGISLNEISYNLGRFMTINDFKQYVMSRSGFLKEKQLYFDLYEKKYVKQ